MAGPVQVSSSTAGSSGSSATGRRDEEPRENLRRRGRRLEWLTLGASTVEAIVGIAASRAVGSMALLAFGLQSLIEALSGGTMLWRLRSGAASGSFRERERLSLRVIGVSLLLVAAYVLIGSARDLWLREAPAPSWLGIGLAVASLIAMPLLARAKRRVASGLHSAALRADAVHTDVCTWQAAIMLAGLGLNIAFRWWWADPAAALLMVPFIAREGVRALRGEACGCVDCFHE